MEKETLNQEIKLKDIVKITKGKLIVGNEEEICENFCRDSREVKEGDIYLGIKGEKINGSVYYEEAFLKGAKGVIVQEIEIGETQKQKYQDRFILLVENTIEAMQKIASYKRKLYPIPIIAITGSVGKTSTKDMVASVMSEQYNTLKTQGNYNNHIGLPLTIFRLKKEEIAVVEMGMSALGEIRTLTNIAKPNIAVITNIGTSHIGQLGSQENITKAKLEILEGLQPGGHVVINNDNEILHKWYLENKENKNIITYGIERESDYMAENIVLEEKGSKYQLKGTNQIIEIPVGGNHFVQNSLCAIAIGSIFKIPMEKIKQGIAKFELTKKRMETIQIAQNITIINDSYNANYDSMKAALNYLGTVEQKRKIAVLGDMLNLGEYSQDLHEKVGKEVVKNKIDILITVGEEAKNIAKIAKEKGIKVTECKTNEEAIKEINKIKQEKDCILLKASNGMCFGEILEGIK